MAHKIDLEKRIIRLKTELKKNSKSKKKWYELGTALLQVGEETSALDVFDRALKIDPKYADAWSGKGDALFRLDRLDDAEKCFKTALELDPKNQNALYNMGITSVSNKDWRLANLYFSRLLDVAPGHNYASRWKKRLVREMRHGERRVWLFAGTAETWDKKLNGDYSWGAHENSTDIPALGEIAKGDIVLAYRRPPHDDIVSIMEVDSWMYIDRSTTWSHRIRIVPRINVDEPIPMEAVDRGNMQLYDMMRDSGRGDVGKMIYAVPTRMWGGICENIIKTAPRLKGPIDDMIGDDTASGVEFNMDMTTVPSDLMVTEGVIMHILTALKSGRNVLLYGPAHSGKRRVLDFIAEKICGIYFDDEGRKQYNYTSCVGNGLWSERDVFGSWEFDRGEKSFKKGFFPIVLDSTVRSTSAIGRPHYLLIHNIDKGIASKSLMQALNSLTNRGAHPPSESNIPKLTVPRSFRIMATADVESIRDLVKFTDLSKNFILIEMEVPKDGSEYTAIPRMVQQRLMDLGAVGEDVIDAKTTSMQEREIRESPFENDVDHSILHAYDKLMSFISEDTVPPPGDNISVGVRTYRGVGSQILVDIMVGVVNTISGYSRADALENAVISDILPALSDLDKEALGNIMLRAIDVFGLESRVADTLDRMARNAALPDPRTRENRSRGSGGLGGSGGSVGSISSLEAKGMVMNSRGATINILNPVEQKKKDKIDEMIKEDEDKKRKKSRADMVKLNSIPVDYTVDMVKVSWELSIHPAVVDQIRTNLESGRNIILYGPPGCGKTKIATLLCEQLCGEHIVKGEKHPNYTILTANAEWDNYEMVGGISPTVGDGSQQVVYKFKDGIVTETVRKCMSSLNDMKKPHYLVIDEFNRANIDEAFGKLFTVFEYRDKQPLLGEDQNDGIELKVPRQYRIIGTMNAKDKNTLFDMGYALMRRFAFIEIGLPEKKDEYLRLNHFVRLRLHELGISFPKDLNGSRFPNDPDDVANELYKKLMAFVEEESLPREGEEIPRGVRTYRQIGTAQLIDCMVTILNAPEGYSREDALEDAVISNILPQLENLEKSHISNIYLKALKVFGKRSAVTLALDRMIKSPMLSIFG